MRNTLKYIKITGIALALVFVSAPTPAAAQQFYSCDVQDRACLLETISFLQSVLASYSTNFSTPRRVTNNFPLTSFSTGSDRSELNRLWRIHDDITEDTIDVFDDGYDTDEVAELLDDAADDLFDAEGSLGRGGNFRVSQHLASARSLLAEAEDELDDLDRSSRRSSNGDRDDAEDAIDEAADELRDAKDEVDDADDDGYDINDAEDFLDDAEELLEDAEDAFDDRDYDDAIDFARDAEREIEDALDEIEYSSRNDREDARDAIDDFEDELKDAWDEVDDSNASRSRIRNAEDFLEDAEDLFEDAEDAYDDRDYDVVLDLIEDAEDAVDDALNEL